MKPLATKFICFACYQKHRRAAISAGVLVDRTTPAVRKEHIKLQEGYKCLLKAANLLGFDEDETRAVLRIAAPHLEPISAFNEAILIYPTPTEPEPTVNVNNENPNVNDDVNHVL